jgi:AmiR/NasT family two-component response regulator
MDASPEADAHQLEGTLAGQRLVGEALGILMERYTVQAGTAFAALAEVARATHVDLRDVAGSVVQTVAEPGTPVPHDTTQALDDLLRAGQ